ncbi:unnamed protein product [Camellia sinensis]
MIIYLSVSFHSRSYQAHQSNSTLSHIFCKSLMGSMHKQQQIYNHESQSLHPIKNEQNLAYQPSFPTSDPGFPILAIAVLCIIVTVFLLVSYYVFVTKCCLNWQQFDPLRRFSMPRPPQNEDPLTAYSPSWQSHGLDDLLIREIPTFQYSRGENGGEKSLCKCVVCLNEFQELDMVRVLPNCGHAFHLDCIDIWLQSNANCPLCRSSISGTTRYPIDQLVAPTSSPQDPRPFVDTFNGGDEAFVVIELAGADRTVMQPRRQLVPERNDPREQLMLSRVHFPGKFEQKLGKQAKEGKFHLVSSMGDECIDVRQKDDRFCIEQPIRRSFSMDSAADRHVCLAVQEIRRQNENEHLRHSEASSSSRVRRSFFSFGHGRGSRSAILPIEF